MNVPAAARASVAAAAIACALVSSGCGAIRDNEHALCVAGGPTVLMAESVPTAALVPCVRSLPIGWRFGRFAATDRGAMFTLDSDLAGKGALRVEMSASCRTGAARRERSDEAGAALFVAATEPVGGRGGAPLVHRWFYRFDGGCVGYSLTAPARERALLRQVRAAASFMTRRSIDRALREDTGRGLPPA